MEDDPEAEDLRNEYEFEKRMEQVGHFMWEKKQRIVMERIVKRCGNGCHVYLPRIWAGKKVKVELVDNEEDI